MRFGRSTSPIDEFDASSKVRSLNLNLLVQGLLAGFLRSGFGGSMDWFLNVKDAMRAPSTFRIVAGAKSPVLNIVQVACRNASARMRHRGVVVSVSPLPACDWAASSSARSRMHARRSGKGEGHGALPVSGELTPRSPRPA